MDIPLDIKTKVIADETTKPVDSTSGEVASSNLNNAEEFALDINITKRSIREYLEKAAPMTELELLNYLKSTFEKMLLIPLEVYEIRSPKNYIFLSFVQKIINLLGSGIPLKAKIPNGIENEGEVLELEDSSIHELSELFLNKTITEEEFRNDFATITLISKAYRYSIPKKA